MYGSMIRASGSTVGACSTNPGTRSSHTVMPASTSRIAMSTTESSEMTLRATRHASASPSRDRVSMKTGTKAEDRAPSPNSARKRFGRRKATTKSDMEAEVPNAAAVRVSRNRPRKRLRSVKPPTLKAERMTRDFSTSAGWRVTSVT